MLQIWREDYDKESTLTGAPFFQICIRPETKEEALTLLSIFNGSDKSLVEKEISKLIAERKVLAVAIQSSEERKEIIEQC